MSARQLRIGSTSFIALAIAAMSTPAFAQKDAADDAAADNAKEIVVTGSLIRGSREDAPAPIDVIGAEELSRQGSPSAIDLLKNLPNSSGIIGDANQFDARAQGNEGVASVNLRGLGPQRTLVLLNGKRIVQSGGSGIPIVDVNLIPSGAIGRIEVLKDGAAATYGSDAIAGVVNFITRTNQDGFRASADYRYISGSNGDYGGALSFGHSGDGGRIFVSAGYQRRSELRTTDRDFTIQPYPNNPQGGWTGGGNPGNFDFNATVGGLSFTTEAWGIVHGLWSMRQALLLAVAIDPEAVLKVLANSLPKPCIAVIAATAISAASSPYSIAVAPASSLIKRSMRAMVVLHPARP